MVDHPDHSPQSYSGSQRQQQQHQQTHHHQQQHHQQQPHQQYRHQLHAQHQHQHQAPSHHPSSQTQRAYQHYNQDIQGPLSAGVIEGHRAFPSFHGSQHHHHRARPAQTTLSTSYPNLSVADILDRYQDAHKDFLVSILNAKAKEDERKAEEERYKTEQIRLQSKQLELELALEQRRGSPPAGRSFATSATEASSKAHYSASTPSYRTSYPTYPNSTPLSAVAAPGPAGAGSGDAPHQQQYGRHHEHSGHSAQDTTESHQQSSITSSKHASSAGRHHPYQQDQQAQAMQASPQSGRPPSLKINTAVRQSYPKPHQRVSPQHEGSTLPPLSQQQQHQQGPVSSKSSGRHHYTLPALSSSSAHSSPVANIDYQSHIPPPLTPKDEHISPTSALSPAPGQNLKRKSIHHDAVMDAVRAKVLRNAGQTQQQREQHQQQQQQQHQLQKKTSMDAASRRKAQLHQQNNSPERPKRTTENNGTGSAVSTMAGPKSKHNYSTTSPSKLSPYSEGNRVEGPLLASLPLTASPTSPSTPVSATAGSGPSRSCSPPSAGAIVTKASGEAPVSTKSLRKDNHNGYGRASIRDDVEDLKMTSPTSKYEMDRTRADRSSEIGVLAV